MLIPPPLLSHRCTTHRRAPCKQALGYVIGTINSKCFEFGIIAIPPTFGVFYSSQPIISKTLIFPIPPRMWDKFRCVMIIWRISRYFFMMYNLPFSHLKLIRCYLFFLEETIMLLKLKKLIEKIAVIYSYFRLPFFNDMSISLDTHNFGFPLAI